MSKKLEVFYHGKPVGILAETPDKLIAFQYSDEWLAQGFSISPLSLPLRGDVFVPKCNSMEKFGGLLGVFADSLPDSWGELLLDRHLQSLGVSKENITTIDRLAYVGNGGMGALEYHPAKEAEFDIRSVGIDYDTLARECGELLASRTSDKLDELYRMGGSSGGTRPKIFLLENKREWIVKFPARKDPAISGKREYDYSICAKQCGIEMTDTDLVSSSICKGYFKTERFDRDKGNKIFTTTFAGLLEADFRAPSCDYSTFMKLVRTLTKDNVHDKEQMYMIMCMNVLTHNRDDHTKNFSFIHTDSNGWRLAPAYDLTYSETYWGEHTTSVNGKGKDILDEDLFKVGTEAGLSNNYCVEKLEEIRAESKALAKYFTGQGNKNHMTFEEKLADLSSSLS